MTQDELDARLAENFAAGAERLLAPKRAELEAWDQSIRAEEYGPPGPTDVPMGVEQAAGRALHEAKYMLWRLHGPLDFGHRDSTLEGTLHLALMVAAEVLSGEPLSTERCLPPCEYLPAGGHVSWVKPPPFTSVLGLCTQHHVGRYRVDFLLTGYLPATDRHGEKREVRVVIELDGHEFHERTKEQAARDRRRDRELQQQGMLVFRFTGSEVWADPVGCAAQAVRMALGQPAEGAVL